MSTPIDPNEYEELGEVYLEALVEGESGFMAVARAVLPDGYVAVPVADLRELDDDLYDYALRWGHLTDDNDFYRMDGTQFDGKDAMCLADAARRLRTLLPKEETE